MSKGDDTYHVVKFQRFPGVYFNKIGRLHPVESTWKIVIKLDIVSLNKRLVLVNRFADRQQRLCNTLRLSQTAHSMCRTVNNILGTDINQAQQLLKRVETMYQQPGTDKRRGLINGLGSLAKALFGTMDANDEAAIKEQLTLIETNQNTLSHAVKNQIHVLNASLSHLQKLENVVQTSEREFMNITRRFRQEQTAVLQQENLNEHATLLSAITTELVRDLEDTVEYLLHAKNGVLHPRFTPIEHIMKQLKEVANHLPRDTHFPFVPENSNWIEVEKFIGISAYCDGKNILSILKIPLIMYPAFDIINIIPLPTHTHDDIFASMKVTYTKVAVQSNTKAYMKITNEELQYCRKSENVYICPRQFPIYKVNTETACELQIYTQRSIAPKNCNVKYVKLNDTLVIALQNQHEWVYTTRVPRDVDIYCKNGIQTTTQIISAGLLRVTQTCKIIIGNITMYSPGLMDSGIIETYIPDYNLSSLPLENNVVDYIPEMKIQEVVSDPDELNRLGKELGELNTELTRQPYPFTHKYFLIPTAVTSIIIITIVIVIIIIAILLKRTSSSRALP